MRELSALQYRRNDDDFARGAFRVRGDTIDIFPAHYEDRAWRIELFGDEVDTITEFDPLTGKSAGKLDSDQGLCQFALCDAAPHAGPGDERHQGGTAPAARRVPRQWQAAGSAAAGTAHAIRHGDDRGHGLLRGHRELFALADRAQAGRAAADPVRISARRCAGVLRRKPCHGAADRRHVQRRLPAQIHARRNTASACPPASTTAR